MDVDINFEDIVAGLDEDGRLELVKMLCAGNSVPIPEVPFGAGQGDQQRIHTIIERAFLAANALPDVPQELTDLFWLIHGRAMS
ncbi:hypothetical protein ABE493_07710 [Stenotrophomonas terrae]|uniref:hypothetical protein n=1 Tax=Stenotrophomonas terrae TaxID=405446 RepID=UPI00320B7ABD